MKNHLNFEPRPPKAFTLIEMLVVIGIIGLLAAMIVPLSALVAKKKVLALAQAQLGGLEMAIEGYWAKKGQYPPDNPINPAINPLFYELKGTVYINDDKKRAAPKLFFPLAGGAAITPSDIGTVFNVGGFVNAVLVNNPSNRLEAVEAGAEDFYKNLKPNLWLEVQDAANRKFVLLGLATKGPEFVWPPGGDLPPNKRPFLSPWRYVSSNPVNNPGSYDLWIDLIIGGKTNRVCNWSKEPLVVN